MKDKSTPDDTYKRLRSLILLEPRQHEAAESFARCIVEWRQSGAVVTVWGDTNGDSSIYLSTGGGFLGGAGRPFLRERAQILAHAGFGAEPLLERTEEEPEPPRAGDLRVTLVRADGLATRAVDERKAQQRKGPLFVCYAHAQDLITAWRETQERDPALREEAKKLERSLEIEPENPAGWSNLGVLRWELGDFAEGLRCLGRAIELEPSAIYFANRAHVHGSAGDVAAAIADLTRAIELAPGIEHVWYNRALAYRDSGRPNEALADVEQALLLGPRRSATLLLRASILERLGREEEAAQDVEAARRNP